LPDYWCASCSSADDPVIVRDGAASSGYLHRHAATRARIAVAGNDGRLPFRLFRPVMLLSRRFCGLRTIEPLRSALALLAEQPNGVPEAVMTAAHSFSDEQLDELVQTGLAVRETRRVHGSGPDPLRVGWLVITNDGRVTLAALQAAARPW
jgi:hypothetical protein